MKSSKEPENKKRIGEKYQCEKSRKEVDRWGKEENVKEEQEVDECGRENRENLKSELMVSPVGWEKFETKTFSVV